MKFWIYYDTSVATGERANTAHIFPDSESIMQLVDICKENEKNNSLASANSYKIVAIQEIQIDNDQVFTIQYNYPSEWKSELMYLVLSRHPSVLLGEKTLV